MKVRAIKKGYYKLMLREPNTNTEVFDIEDNGDFSDKWMEKVGSKPDREQHHEDHADKMAKDYQEGQLKSKAGGPPDVGYHEDPKMKGKGVGPTDVGTSRGRVSDKSPI